MTKVGRGLNPKQRAFMEAYLAQPLGSRNATQCAIQVGYSKRTAKQAAARLLTHPGIRKHLIAADQSRRQETARIDDNWLLTEAVHLWETPWRVLFNDDGSVKSIPDMSDAAQQLVAGFKIRQTEELVWNDEDEGWVNDPKRRRVVEIIDLKFIDKLKVLDMVGRHTQVNAFGDKEKAEAASSFADLLRAMRHRVVEGGVIDAQLVEQLTGGGGDGEPDASDN